MQLKNILALGLQNANHPLNIMGFCALLCYILSDKRHKFIMTLTISYGLFMSHLESSTKYWRERDTESSVHLCLTS